MHYEPCSEIIGGARALLPMEDYAYDRMGYCQEHVRPSAVVCTVD